MLETAVHHNVNQRKNETRSSSRGGYMLILGCSATKRDDVTCAPAITFYDGVNFRVIRKYLNQNGWPPGLSIKIVSAKYGLIDATRHIEWYDERMTREKADRWNRSIVKRLVQEGSPDSVFISLGQDYLPAIHGIETAFPDCRVSYATGGIGVKMNALKRWLKKLPNQTASVPRQRKKGRKYLYLFPDWDDYVYDPFVVNESDDDRKSGMLKKKYAHQLFGEDTPYDGLLVSLAQLKTGKGALSRIEINNGERCDLRKIMRLPKRLMLFGDCGAFSYVSESTPPFTSQEAAEFYDRLGFDIGASVDHIPLSEIVEQNDDGQRVRVPLSDSTRRRRMKLTVQNAESFLKVCKRRKYGFVPLGVVQGIGVRSYAKCVHEYVDMGYRHLAIGGLVPRTDGEILEICCKVRQAVQDRTRGKDENIWIHLFGILRPKLQESFRALGISSFDSASYFRKAWLRSDQNYLSPDGQKWYSSIRVPISTSKPMRNAAEAESLSPEQLCDMEQRCLMSLESFDGSEEAKAEVQESINEYGPLLQRKGEDNHFIEKHSALMTDQPWKKCRCPFCMAAGIQVVVFRGANRNKRRGLHNTFVFYHKVLHGGVIPKQ